MNIIKRYFVRCLTAVVRPLLLISSDVSDVLGGLIRRPFEDLRSAWSRLRTNETAVKAIKPTHWRMDILRWPLFLIHAAATVMLRILTSPVELLVSLIRWNQINVLWAIPGLICLVVISIVAYRVYFVDGTGFNTPIGQLRNLANTSLSSGDFELAATQYGELIAASSLPLKSDQLNWAIALSSSGKIEAAAKVFGELAPGPGGLPGYPAAHRVLALGISSQLKMPPDPAILKSLHWHLECSQDTRSPEINRVWAQYYLSINDQRSALRHLKSAAQIQPEYMVVVAEIYGAMKDDIARDEALRTAEDLFKKKVEQEPLNVQARITYAKVLFELKQYDRAEQVFLAGRKFENGQELRSACASFYLSLYQIKNSSSSPNNPSLDIDFEMLRKSLEQDINHVATYQELIGLYQSAKSEGKKDAIVRMLHDNLAKDQSAALCHLSLSNILWMENELAESQTHMERAFELNPELSIVANNLAWILAHADPPELDRAYEIANQVVKRNPADGRFRDTLATILMKQEKYAQSLTEFQKAIATVDDPQDVHQKMATIYRKLNKAELANYHQEQANAN